MLPSRSVCITTTHDIYNYLPLPHPTDNSFVQSKLVLVDNVRAPLHHATHVESEPQAEIKVWSQRQQVQSRSVPGR